MSWELDDRGKPCKWSKVYFTPEEAATGVKELDAEINKLADSGEHYVLRTPPQMVTERDMEFERMKYIVRARVRWCVDEATAKRLTSFHGDFLAEAAKAGYVQKR